MKRLAGLLRVTVFGPLAVGLAINPRHGLNYRLVFPVSANPAILWFKFDFDSHVSSCYRALLEKCTIALFFVVNYAPCSRALWSSQALWRRFYCGPFSGKWTPPSRCRSSSRRRARCRLHRPICAPSRCASRYVRTSAPVRQQLRGIGQSKV